MTNIIKTSFFSPVVTSIGGAGLGAAGGFLWDRIEEYLYNRKIKSTGWGSRAAILGALGTVPGLMQGWGQYTLTKGAPESVTLTPWFSKEPYTEVRSVSDLENPLDAWFLDSKKLTEKSKNFDLNSKKEGSYKIASLINTDVFGNIIWEDPNTHFQNAAAVNNLLTSTSQKAGSPFVTPGQIATNLINAGIGSATGWVVGNTLGALAGLSPDTRSKIQEMGTWGGLMNGIGNQIR